MSDGDPVGPVGCLFGWPGGSLGQWLAALGTLALMLGALYLLFAWLGW